MFRRLLPLSNLRILRPLHTRQPQTLFNPPHPLSVGRAVVPIHEEG
jgi:hypothetical protein